MDQTPLTRPSLLVRLKDTRDQRAWSEFMEIYEPVIYRLARRNGLQDADAREVTQDVVVAVSRAIPRWDPDRRRGSFRGWLTRVTRNLTINLVIRQARRPQASGGTDMARRIAQQADRSRDPGAIFDLEYRRRVFRWAAERIRGDFQDATWRAFHQTCVEGKSIQEVAARLNMSVGAVYVARSRVLARLKKTIESLSQDV